MKAMLMSANGNRHHEVFYELLEMLGSLSLKYERFNGFLLTFGSNPCTLLMPMDARDGPRFLFRGTV